MQAKFQELLKLSQKIYDLNAAQAVLDWDQQTYMPPGASALRGEACATLESTAHELATSGRYTDLLETLHQNRAEFPQESLERLLLRRWWRDYERNKRISSEFVAANARVCCAAFSAWEQAKEEANFEILAPYLEEVFELKRQYAEFFAPYKHIYDPLLDEYEPGLTTEQILPLFARLRSGQCELLERIKHSEVNPKALTENFNSDKQWQLALQAAQGIGFDFKRGRLDRAEHPFTTDFGRDDVRITTHIYEDNLLSVLFSTLHEAGHGIYQQQVSPDLARTVLNDGASLGIHESQSRLWENFVGRSKPYLKNLVNDLKVLFPGQARELTWERLYGAANRVEPSLIRTEADEATYNLHIMLRFELEVAILTGEIAVRDLPLIWHDKMREYLGVTPKNDREGVLQDVHWPTGGIGYFPTYTIGNLVAAQLWQKLSIDCPEAVNGNWQLLKEWLTSHIYCHGAKYLPSELLSRNGLELSSEPYLAYLNQKYGEIYQLSK